MYLNDNRRGGSRGEVEAELAQQEIGPHQGDERACLP